MQRFAFVQRPFRIEHFENAVEAILIAQPGQADRGPVLAHRLDDKSAPLLLLGVGGKSTIHLMQCIEHGAPIVDRCRFGAIACRRDLGAAASAIK